MFILGLALLSALLVRFMIAAGTIDHPGERSSHSVPTPKGGGVGIVAAAALGLAVHGHGIMAGAALALAAASYADDIVDFPFFVKLAAQIAAALAVCWALPASRIDLPGLPAFWLPAPVLLCAAWAVFVTNAVNFMDGLNGLASGCIAIACGALALAGGTAYAAVSLPLAAGIAGFLPFNFPRARIFMGDVGSQACGLLTAGFAVLAAGDARLSLIVPLGVLPLLLDVIATLARRARQGARLTQAHRGHFYQVANRAGMAAPRVTFIYWGMCAWGALCGAAAGAARMAPVSAGAVALSCIPFAIWAIFVRREAARAGLTAW